MKITREQYDKYLFPCYVPQQMVLTKGKGVYLFDNENNKYLDLSAGIAVNALGHANAHVIKAIVKQSNKFLHLSNVFTNDKTIKLAKKLCKISHFQKVFFVNSGTEANECALKLARKYCIDKYNENKFEIVSFENSFHGRTFLSVCVGGKDSYSSGFGPKVQGIRHAKFNDLKSVEQNVNDNTAAIVLEMIQGEGGVIEASEEFLNKITELSIKHKALIIVDEVQTGVGRTGKSIYTYLQHKGFKPDIVTTAKGLAGGIPIGAILTTDEIAKVFTPGTHGSTFGGNPFACAVALDCLKIIAKDDFLQKVSSKGEYFKELLSKLNDKYQIFSQIRGQGLLIGAQLNEKYKDKASDFMALCTKEHLLVLTAGKNVIRFTPALTIKYKQLDKAYKILDEVIYKFIEQN